MDQILQNVLLAKISGLGKNIFLMLCRFIFIEGTIVLEIEILFTLNLSNTDNYLPPPTTFYTTKHVHLK